MDEKEYMDLQKRHIMSELPITTIILLALKGQDIREKPPAEFYDIFRKISIMCIFYYSIYLSALY